MCVVLAVLFVLTGCQDTSSEILTPVTCYSQTDCPGTSYCQEGLCVAPAAVLCIASFDCPTGMICLSDGQCGYANQCNQNSDCCGGGTSECTQECSGGVCVGTECTVGVQEACFVDCNKGVRFCENGLWLPCDAPASVDVEACDDGIDNDCNGLTDEGCSECAVGEEEECSSECGTGIKACEESLFWGLCDAPTNCSCSIGEVKSELCGSCGFQETTCSPDETWLQPGLCQGEGACEAGAVEEVECGSCGIQSRLCTDECTWGEYSECSGAGECSPGELKSSSCGNCGTFDESCTDACVWEALSECNEGAGCVQGEEQEVSCGLCGVQISVCDAVCAWGEFGQCINEGVCTPGEVDTQDCGSCGESTRVCRDDCLWAEWTDCEGSGVCSPGSVDTEDCGPSNTSGECALGSHYKTCNVTCQWSAWSACEGAVYPELEICGNGTDEDCNGSDLVELDEYEPNDDCYSCVDLGTDPNLTIYPTTHTENDTDFFCFTADDGFNVPGFGESIEIELIDQPIGMDNDIHLFKGYENCVSNNAIAASVTVGGQDESLSWDETNSDDEGVYILRVTPYEASSCYKPYTLNINGLN